MTSAWAAGCGECPADRLVRAAAGLHPPDLPGAVPEDLLSCLEGEGYLREGPVPSSLAPREAASITPPRPPQQRTAWPAAMRPPARSAARYSSTVHSSFPMTAICMLCLLYRGAGGPAD
jgi:hypothetical protein